MTSFLKGHMLGGIFLGSALALSSQAGASTQPVSVGVITSTIPPAAKGEENFRHTVRFRDIAQHGDPRLQRIVSRFRQSSLGEEAYQYAVDKNLRFKWARKLSGKLGSYTPAYRRVEMDASLSDDEILSVLSHEIRHAWQYHTLRTGRWKLDPADKWRMLQFMEADSCAFNAHFIANYKQETGHTLLSFISFSNRVTNPYVLKAPQDRRYVEDALEPCFKAVRDATYPATHMKRVRSHYKSLTSAYNRAIRSGEYGHALRYRFDTSDQKNRAVLFSGFMNMSLDPARRLPGYGNAAFLDWLEKQTPYDSPADTAEGNRMQSGFRTMREQLLRLNGMD